MTTFLPPPMCSSCGSKSPEPSHELCLECAHKQAIFVTLKSGRLNYIGVVVAIVGVIVAILFGILTLPKKENRKVEPPSAVALTIGTTVVTPVAQRPPASPLAPKPALPRSSPPERSHPEFQRSEYLPAWSYELGKMRSAKVDKQKRVTRVDTGGPPVDAVALPPDNPERIAPPNQESEKELTRRQGQPSKSAIETSEINRTADPTVEFIAKTTVTAYRERARPRWPLQVPFRDLRWPVLESRCTAIEVTINRDGYASTKVMDPGGVPQPFIERARENAATRWYPAISSEGRPTGDVCIVRYCWSRGRP